MSDPMEIAGRIVGPGHPPYIVAELSGNHGGSLTRALQLVEVAAEAGADALKLQTYTADTITIDHDGPGFIIKEGLWKGRTLHSLYQEASTPWEWHEALFAKCRELGIAAFSSPFDWTAVDFLQELEVPAYKIASFEILDIPLIEKAAATGKPLIFSTGMANDTEIREAIAAARSAGAKGVVVLHCNSGYPTPAGDANLLNMAHLKALTNAAVGLSDHTLGTAVPVAAVALGAVMIEKHLTIRRADGGPDAAFSLEPQEFERLCRDCRAAFESLGEARRGVTASESTNVQFRRSLYIVQDVQAGEVFTIDNVRSIRPGFGLAPKHLRDILGKGAAVDVSRGTPLSWDLIA